MSYVITFLIFVLPLIIFPFGNSQFEIPKVILAEAITQILFIIFLVRTNLSQIKIDKRFLALLSVITSLTFIDIIFMNRKNYFFVNQFRLQGIFLLWTLLILAFMASQIVV